MAARESKLLFIGADHVHAVDHEIDSSYDLALLLGDHGPIVDSAGRPSSAWKAAVNRHLTLDGKIELPLDWGGAAPAPTQRFNIWHRGMRKHVKASQVPFSDSEDAATREVGPRLQGWLTTHSRRAGRPFSPTDQNSLTDHYRQVTDALIEEIPLERAELMLGEEPTGLSWDELALAERRIKAWKLLPYLNPLNPRRYAGEAAVPTELTMDAGRVVSGLIRGIALHRKFYAGPGQMRHPGLPSQARFEEEAMVVLHLLLKLAFAEPKGSLSDHDQKALEVIRQYGWDARAALLGVIRGGAASRLANYQLGDPEQVMILRERIERWCQEHGESARLQKLYRERLTQRFAPLLESVTKEQLALVHQRRQFAKFKEELRRRGLADRANQVTFDEVMARYRLPEEASAVHRISPTEAAYVALEVLATEPTFVTIPEHDRWEAQGRELPSWEKEAEEVVESLITLGSYPTLLVRDEYVRIPSSRLLDSEEVLARVEWGDTVREVLLHLLLYTSNPYASSDTEHATEVSKVYRRTFNRYFLSPDHGKRNFVGHVLVEGLTRPNPNDLLQDETVQGLIHYSLGDVEKYSSLTSLPAEEEEANKVLRRRIARARRQQAFEMVVILATSGKFPDIKERLVDAVKGARYSWAGEGDARPGEEELLKHLYFHKGERATGRRFEDLREELKERYENYLQRVLKDVEIAAANDPRAQKMREFFSKQLARLKRALRNVE